ncbi:hypothetical protein BLOT_007663 [Blomia tropicalis]|nr:hypothetical protein BLOT_007663 [Blomia tropicalis]
MKDWFKIIVVDHYWELRKITENISIIVCLTPTSVFDTIDRFARASQTSPNDYNRIGTKCHIHIYK